jgi:hypothetical protein
MNYTIPGLAPMPTLGMTQLQLMQMLPLGGKLALSGRVVGAQASATMARAQDVVWDVRTQTAMAFYDLYATDRGLDVARETLRLLHDIAKTAESMYRVGEGRQADVLRANVEIANMAEDTLRTFQSRVLAFDTSTVSDETARTTWLPFARDSLSIDAADAELVVTDWLHRQLLRSVDPLLPGQQLRVTLLNQKSNTLRTAVVTLSPGLSNVVLR